MGRSSDSEGHIAPTTNESSTADGIHTMIKYSLFMCTADSQIAKIAGQAEKYLCPQCNGSMKLIGTMHENDSVT